MSSPLSPQMHQLFDSLPGWWGCKDLQLNYLYASAKTAQLAGFEDPHALVGLSDLDLPCTKQCAHLFRAQDREVIDGAEQLRVLDIQRGADLQWRTYLTTRLPFRESGGQIAGALFYSQEVNARELLALGDLFYRLCRAAEEADRLIGHRSRSSADTPERGDEARLSQRQEEVLFLLLRGQSPRRIAATLGVSARTVDCHVLALKGKFATGSRQELILRAIESGGFNHLPPGFSKRPLSIVLSEGRGNRG